jgi:hypothetical protein
MLAKPEPSQAKFIWAGYIFAILGGLWNCYYGEFISHKKDCPMEV